MERNDLDGLLPRRDILTADEIADSLRCGVEVIKRGLKGRGVRISAGVIRYPRVLVLAWLQSCQEAA